MRCGARYAQRGQKLISPEPKRNDIESSNKASKGRGQGNAIPGQQKTASWELILRNGTRSEVSLHSKDNVGDGPTGSQSQVKVYLSRYKVSSNCRPPENDILAGTGSSIKQINSNGK